MLLGKSLKEKQKKYHRPDRLENGDGREEGGGGRLESSAAPTASATLLDLFFASLFIVESTRGRRGVVGARVPMKSNCRIHTEDRK